jgi:hypothetical protein
VGSGSLIVTPVSDDAPLPAEFETVTVNDAVPPSEYVDDPVVFVILRIGGVQLVEAFAVCEVSPVAPAAAVLLRVVQRLLLPVGTLVLTVTIEEAPAASVPGEQVSVPLVTVQAAPELWDDIVHVRRPPTVGNGSEIVTPEIGAAPAGALLVTVIVKDAVPPSV